MYDVIYEAEIALCNINKQPLQLILKISSLQWLWIMKKPNWVFNTQ